MKIQENTIEPLELSNRIRKMWEVSAGKILAIEAGYQGESGAPVFTVEGRYTARGWTEWTQGFQYGSALLQFEATGEREFLELGRERTVSRMAPHVTHMGVHDHGFNQVSTYGNLWRMMNEGLIEENPWERHFYELALKCSGAVQARRWTSLGAAGGYIYSFNGPHSLFSDTVRSLRALALAHLLGHVLMEENDRKVSLLQRLIAHADATARFNVYYGEERDAYDVRGRVVHESIFNVNDGRYRCPSTQQGYSPFSTWSRGLAWILCGYAEQLEFFETLPDEALEAHGGRPVLEALLLRAARATADFYIAQTPADGIPYWDFGAPGLERLGEVQKQAADPFNDHEPVDSSAAAIAAQGLLRLGRYLSRRNEATEDARRYWQAGIAVAGVLLDEPYLSLNEAHQGLLLHSVYHRPNGWDYVPPGRRVSSGEACQWGDYHLRELALYLQRVFENQTYLTFFAGAEHRRQEP